MTEAQDRVVTAVTTAPSTSDLARATVVPSDGKPEVQTAANTHVHIRTVVIRRTSGITRLWFTPIQQDPPPANTL